jgi:hypothetical protein
MPPEIRRVPVRAVPPPPAPLPPGGARPRHDGGA